VRAAPHASLSPVPGGGRWECATRQRRVTNSDLNFKQPKLRRPYSYCRPGRGLRLFAPLACEGRPSKCEGLERRMALCLWSPPFGGGAFCENALATRRSSCGVIYGSGRASRGLVKLTAISQLLAGGHSASGRSPETARARGLRSRARGRRTRPDLSIRPPGGASSPAPFPRAAPPQERLMKRPLASRRINLGTRSLSGQGQFSVTAALAV
jgi:hypothetical protein